MAGLWPAGWEPGNRTAGPSALILSVALPAALQRQAGALRRQLGPEAARRAPAHVSLFRHLPGLQQDSLVGDMRTVSATCAPAFLLEPPVRWGGLWVARVRSDCLDALRADLADRWHGLLSPGDLAPPRLHLSLGFGTQPPLPLPEGPWRAPGLLLWQHNGPNAGFSGGPAEAGGKPRQSGRAEHDGAFWTPLVACAFRR